MGAGWNPTEHQVRSDRAFAQTCGRPVAGGAGSIATDGTDKVVSLVGGFTYLIQAITADVYIAIGAPGETAGNGTTATNAANRLRLRAGAVGPMPFMVPQAGATLHVTQVTGAGVLEYTQMDDVW